MRSAKSLFEKRMEDPAFREKYELEKPLFNLEMQVLAALEQMHLSFEEFGKRVATSKSNVSRDLKSGLKAITIKRLKRWADALGMDLVTLLIPRNVQERRRKLQRAMKRLLEGGHSPRKRSRIRKAGLRSASA